MNQWIRIAGWVIIGLTSLFFIQIGIQKLVGAKEMIDTFQELGYPDWSRFVVGLVEIAGAILLVVPRWTMYAATALGALMIGAVASELLAGRGFEAVLAGQWLILLAIIAVVRFRILTHSNSRSEANHDGTAN
jgi:uncharacterized membrane protein YphA (DoxX/SURF4 family)